MKWNIAVVVCRRAGVKCRKARVARCSVVRNDQLVFSTPASICKQSIKLFIVCLSNNDSNYNDETDNNNNLNCNNINWNNNGTLTTTTTEL